MGRPLRIQSVMGGGDSHHDKKFSLYVSQQYGGHTLKKIGAYYGMREAAVSQSNRRLREKIDRDERLKSALFKVRRLLNVEA